MTRTIPEGSVFRPLRAAPLLLAAATMLFAVPAQGQLGAKLGFSFATMSNARPDFDTQTGFIAGFSLGLPIGGPLSLQPEALYVQKGTGAGASTTFISGDLELTYVEVPVLVRFDLPLPGIRPFGVAGPMVAFKLECSVGGTDCGDDVPNQDYGVALGAGVRLGGVLGLTFEGRYTWGLKDINDVGAGIDHRTRTFVALAGISF